MRIVAFTLVAQMFSALGSSAGQDTAAISGAHPLAETVLLFPVDLLGLVGSLHSKPLLSRQNLAFN